MPATRIELVGSATQTANGNTSSQRIPTLTMLQCEIDITAATTVTTFDAWLQGSSDGTNWYDLVADLALVTADSATTGTVRANVREVVDNKTTSTAEKFVAVFKHAPASYLRGKWKFAGTDITFSIVVVGK